MSYPMNTNAKPGKTAYIKIFLKVRLCNGALCYSMCLELNQALLFPLSTPLALGLTEIFISLLLRSHEQSVYDGNILQLL